MSLQHERPNERFTSVGEWLNEDFLGALLTVIAVEGRFAVRSQ